MTFDIARTKYINHIEPFILKVKEAIASEDRGQFHVTYVNKGVSLDRFDTQDKVKFEWDWFPQFEFLHEKRDIAWVRLETMNRKVFAKYRDVLNSLSQDFIHVNYDCGWQWGDFDVAGETVHFSKPNYQLFICVSHQPSTAHIPPICTSDSPYADVGVFDWIRHKLGKKGGNGGCNHYARRGYGFECVVNKDGFDDFKKAYEGICDVWVDKMTRNKARKVVHLVFGDSL